MPVSPTGLLLPYFLTYDVTAPSKCVTPQAKTYLALEVDTLRRPAPFTSAAGIVSINAAGTRRTKS